MVSVWVTCTSPVNIAVIKYWGKRDVKLNLPINSSLSGTLSQQHLKTSTTVVASDEFEEDKLFLNGKEEKINERTRNCLRELRERAREYRSSPADPSSPSPPLITPDDWKNKIKLHIYSYNNFPTAAGLASSASGLCCLVYTIAKLMNITGDISEIARQGSGSAARSLYGGFVKWEMGVKEDGSDSLAHQVVDETYWPDIHILICVVNDHRKDVSSTDGMQQSVATSPLIKERIEVVPVRMVEMEKAIKERDFPAFANLTMLDSDHFHEVCHTSIPPIHYLNDVSRNIISLVNSFNSPSIRAAYTYDAGPNAVIYLPSENVPSLSSLLLRYFPTEDPTSFINDQDLYLHSKDLPLPSGDFSSVTVMPNSIKYIIHTTVGGGPEVVDGMKEGSPPPELLFLSPPSN